MFVSVAKLAQPRSFTTITACRTQAVRQAANMPAIGAQMLCGSDELYLIVCLLKINNFGTDAADSHVRIYSSRLLT
jgi:hypothetical protein